MNARRVSLAVLGTALLSAVAFAQSAQAPVAPILAQSSVPGGERPAPGPSVFGTSNSTYQTIGDWKFTPAASSWTYSDTGGNQPMRFMTVAGTWLLAEPELPSGALLTYLEFDYCNTNATQPITLNLYQADYHNNVQFILANLVGPANTGCTLVNIDLTSLNITVDNLFNRYVLYAIFGTNADSTTTLAGAIIGYKLQVSPAPGTATFNDVPTSDFGFQYIEALVASGITGGTGGGNYSPDAFVTRRQMAIFISKALGLSWN